MKDMGVATSHKNPRLQCVVCGAWKRQFNREGERIMVAAADDDYEVTRGGWLADVCKEHYGRIKSIIKSI